jgi:uncharacterized protein YraI
MVTRVWALVFFLSAAVASAHDVVRVKVDSATVRSGPGTGYAAIGAVQLGERYVVAGASGVWRKVWFGPGTGWIHAANVKSVVATHRTVTATLLNVRTGPAATYPIVGQVANGTTWVVVATSGGWSKVWYAGEQRWMYSGYLAIQESNVEFTMIQWSDIHCGAWDWMNTFRRDAVDRLNTLAGRAYPASMGGSVGHVWQVLALGDITESGTPAQWNDNDSWVGDDYVSLRNRLHYPSFEAMGNHDTWGAGAKDGITALHGNTYYSWNRGGIHFIALDQYVLGSSMAAEPDLVPAELAWLEADLDSIAKGVTPVVVFMHSPPKQSLGPWWTTMGDTANDLKDLLTGHKVLLILHGHWHKTMKNTWNGWDLVGSGYCANPDYYGASQTTTVNVIRVKNGQLSVVPFNWDTNAFEPAILVKDIP